MAVNTSPELRDLHSNETTLREIANRTRGEVFTAFNLKPEDLFRREGLRQSASPLPIWDILIPLLLGLIIVDVATRRIAWDWASTKKMAQAASERVRAFTTTRKVESAATLGALKQVRRDVAEQRFRPADEEGEAAAAGGVSSAAAPAARPDPRAKFEAKGVEGDISQLVGGASAKPVPPPPKNPQPKGPPQGPGAHTNRLLEAKRRAQQKIKDRENEAGGGGGG
jgi:hypothetical protein